MDRARIWRNQERKPSTQDTETVEPKTKQTLNTETVNKTEGASSSLSLELNVLSVDTPTTLKRKRGRPRKGTNLAKTILPKHLASMSGETTGKGLTLSLQSESTEEPAEGETDSEVKPKRNRRSKVLHDDYVADFNTSDEEEGGEVFRRFSGRGRGRGRGLKYDFPEAFEDFFSSYNEFFGKQQISGDEGTDGSNFEDLDECDDNKQSLPKEDQSQGSLGGKHKPKNVMEGMIGPDGQTRVQIVNSGDTTMIDGKESLVYIIITTTGERKSITPIIIPKTTSDVGSREKDSMLPLSSSQTDNGNEREGTANSMQTEESNKPLSSSREMQNKQHKDRALLSQVASLKHKYYQALQELKKRPQVATLADLVYSAANFLTEDQLIFFTLQLKSGCPNMPGIKFSVREKMLALAIYLESPTLYKWLSSIFHLPSKLILERWLEGVARNNPEDAKKIVYNIYTRHIFRE